ncbi:B3 domain-containing transcription factor VRN1-like isoform X2 [Rosa rugosa]|uniref:B3 domain-containing transcription factor VRN1-like isoform X2 n=1 Tax=Rosa rugosa TaxID=74645 RepID=UPI002B4133ED|nr:B3 domain-containing transcription factor VRN1-like isoform X2 [Rosa rugosa]
MARRRDPSFFKILLGDHFSHKLIIPGTFLKHFDGNVPEQFRLQTPAKTWLVDVEKVDHKYYFQKGWNEFVCENGLKVKEILVFHYTGNSDFSVDIYGKNTIKKVFVKESHAFPRSKDVGIPTDIDYPMEEADEDDDPSVEILDDVAPYPTSRGEKYQISSPLPHIDYDLDIQDNDENKHGSYKNEEDENEEDVDNEDEDEHESEEEDGDESLSEEENETAEDVDFGDEDQNESEEENESEDEDHNDDGDGDDDGSIEILSEKPPCSKTRDAGGSSRTESFRKPEIPKKMNLAMAVGKHNALQRALDFKSNSVNPCLVLPMRASYARGSYLNFPFDFAKRYLRKQPSNVTFLADGVSWPVKFHYPQNQTRAMAGWSAFARVNKLKESDVCVFVLTDDIKFVFSVAIFRITGAANCTLPSPGRRQTATAQLKSKNNKRKPDRRSNRI